MSCFEVQVLEPSIHTIEIETCINGQVTSLDVVEYTISSLEVTHCVALLPSDTDTLFSGVIPVLDVLGGTGIHVSSNDRIYTIHTSGLQPSGDYSLVGHNHTSSDITNFNSSVSGLLPVKNILSGSGIEVSELNGVFTVGVTGTFGLTNEEVDDRVSNLLTAGQNILLNYDDSGNFLTISTIGLQPSGDYSLIGHNHNSSDILDFITAVSGLLPNTYDAALPWTPNHTLVDGTRYLVNDLVYENGRLYKANYDNESLPVSNTLYWTDVGPGYRLNIDGRDIPNIPYPVTSVNGYTDDVELSTVDLDDFTSAVSGLLPVKDILAGSGISVSSSSGTYTVNSIVNSVEEANKLTTTVFNKTGSLIPKMSVVYINGGQGDQSTIQLAIATNEAGSSKTYGITAEAISHMSTGKVIVEGALTGLNTDQFNPTAPIGNINGTVLYLSPTISGAITTTKPTAPNHLVSIGTVVRTHQNAGVIEVRIQNGFELQELHNVAINGTTNGQFLQYNSGSGLWVASSSGSFTSLNVNNVPVSVSGHSHIASNISNFDNAVSGLLPVKNVIGSGNINVSNSSGSFIISNSGLIKSDITGITGASTIINIVQISQANYDALGNYDPNTLYIIN